MTDTTPAHKIANKGFCHCCRESVCFERRGAWLRDEYLCTNCYSIPRQRHLNLILDRFFPGWEERIIHESSPGSRHISQYASHYSFSQFYEGIEPGSTHLDSRCENLEKLTFNDETFDIFITQDVMEHVFNPQIAFREIMRVVKRNGAHIFTAPKHRGISTSYPRATLEGGQVINFHEPVYHGNPVGDGKALVTWDYGDDFEQLIYQWTRFPTTTYIHKDKGLGIDGEYLEVFVTRKV
jgi:SAM-dependent methyltransferase